MRSQTRLRRHLEPGWSLETPGEGFEEHPVTGNLRPKPATIQAVAVSIQQHLLSGMKELGTTSVLDERVAIILPEDPALPPMEVPVTAELFSPRGECWNLASEGIIRRSAHRRPVYTVASVRRAKEKDRHG